ncbi:HipA N-terminal domain-containing protein [Flavihumibacter sp. UBA7668]|uniref:HipA N-terminal domain-containing protein n=1 Tax=Flavihumibacter sp. UBA7668 TaxID=1946542 RepID=UPI0025BEAC95|nr:HipA N-terminal domain-containing protein [Flavihumibacter sp. UBA7668]
MRSVEIYWNKQLAGLLTEENSTSYTFRYTDEYFADSSKPPVSVTVPKSQQLHVADHLFPVFFNLLSEGANRQLQCRLLKIDEDDDFGLLSATAQYDTIGAITVKPVSK